MQDFNITKATKGVIFGDQEIHLNSGVTDKCVVTY